MNTKRQRHKPRNLRFNFGYLLEADLGTSRIIELDYPDMGVSEDVRLSPLQGSFRATHTSKGIYVQGVLTSEIETECTRCLNTLSIPIEIELDDLFYYPPPAPTGEFAIGEDGFVDLGPLVRELSLLAVPTQVYCQDNCQGLCSNCGQNLNNGRCQCEKDEIDPRLSILRALLEDGD